ncbi:MAG: type II toxin-antitoxin system VapC family toxin [Candidatus Parabeggiatoa sp. nov. 3]|jgi:tRNA(fMet)-specific endonuclease VapC|nr:MAG: type II toxin-antitoxin system VapC family toxin [Gammaproteobacteria bacterium]
MSFLFDTNACIAYLNNHLSPIRRKLEQISSKQVFICSVVKAELFYGAMKSKNPAQTLAKQSVFLNQFVSLPFDDKAAKIFGEIRAHLARLGTPIGPYDLQIAAIALAHNVTLVTHNTREFSRVPNLQIEDWESES